jgi:hypothetical protein
VPGDDDERLERLDPIERGEPRTPGVRGALLAVLDARYFALILDVLGQGVFAIDGNTCISS